MKIIRLNRLQVFNGIAYHKGEDHKVSDSIAETAAKRGALEGEPRDVPAEEAVAPEAPVEAPVETAPAAPAKPKK